MSKKAASTAQPAKSKKAQDVSGEQLSAIRDLLFGAQVSQIETTISDHHKHFSDRLNNLESLIKKTSDQIEKHIQKAVTDINKSMESHHLEHVSQEGILEEKLESIGKSLNDFQEQTENEFGEAHTELDNAAKEIYNSLEKEVKLLSKKIDKTSKDLSSNKADRKTLATLLESMASNLNQSQA